MTSSYLNKPRRSEEEVRAQAHEKLQRDLRASVILISEKCPTCDGTGKAISLAQAIWHDYSKCKDCNGSGKNLESFP